MIVVYVYDVDTDDPQTARTRLAERFATFSQRRRKLLDLDVEATGTGVRLTMRITGTDRWRISRMQSTVLPKLLAFSGLDWRRARVVSALPEATRRSLTNEQGRPLRKPKHVLPACQLVAGPVVDGR